MRRNFPHSRLSPGYGGTPSGVMGKTPGPRGREESRRNCIKDGADATEWNTLFNRDNRKGQSTFIDYGPIHGGNSRAHRLFKVRGSFHQR
jgi:hypothetical protein